VSFGLQDRSLRSLFLSFAVVGWSAQVSMQPQSGLEVPAETVRVARAAFPNGSVAISARDELGEVFTDEQFAAAFGTRGAPAESPGALALVTALQYTENLTDRQAAEMVTRAIDWKYALAMELSEEGFDDSVLAKFRSRLVAHGLEQQIFTRMLEVLRHKGLIKAGGKQRTDATHVISAVRDLNRLELVGESVRAAVEVLAAAAPDWLAQVIAVGEWTERYGVRVDSWRLPTSATKRDRLAKMYGQDALVLLRAVYAESSPAWLAELPAVETLRVVLVQNYYLRTDARGREVIKRREADDEGLPPAHRRVSSPYDTDARWAAKGEDLFWCGFKVHVTETCDDHPDNDAGDAGEDPGGARPNLITNVSTTPATVPDVKMTTPINESLAAADLPPAEHYLDAGYPSAQVIDEAHRRFGITLVTPALLDTSRQARAGDGFDKAAFSIDWAARQVTCPQEQTSASWSPAHQHGQEVIVVKFDTATCRACPVREQCTTTRRSGRQLTLRPRELHEALARAREEQTSQTWKTKYAIRAGAESTMHQGVTSCGMRHARYRGLSKVSLQHAFTAVALNLLRLHDWSTHPVAGSAARRTSHLARLNYALAA
jgi:transposase